jgi:hypothetical protein
MTDNYRSFTYHVGSLKKFLMYQEMMNSIAGVVEVDERTTRKSFSFKKAASWGMLLRTWHNQVVL